MIDLELTEEHIALRQTVREFCQGEVAPHIKEWDEKSFFEPKIFEKMAELGLLGVCIPEQYGGAGFDYISLGLVCEELEACDTFLRVAMSVHGDLVDGDATLWILAQYFREHHQLADHTVVATVMSNIGLELALASNDIKLIRTSVGDKYVLDELLRSGSSLGGEQSGHIIIPKKSLVGDGMFR